MQPAGVSDMSCDPHPHIMNGMLYAGSITQQRYMMGLDAEFDDGTHLYLQLVRSRTAGTRESLMSGNARNFLALFDISIDREQLHHHCFELCARERADILANRQRNDRWFGPSGVLA